MKMETSEEYLFLTTIFYFITRPDLMEAHLSANRCLVYPRIISEKPLPQIPISSHPERPWI
jgi:hypothetical protein